MKDVAKFIFEIGTLKRMERAWFKHEGVANPETVAGHSHRTALIGYILAKLEEADANKVMRMCMFHDTHETRISDLDKLAQRYIDKDKAEVEAMKDQINSLPKEIAEEALADFMEFTERKTKEAIIAKDADTLDLMFQAKEYMDVGYHGARYWLDQNSQTLKTETAKKLHKELLEQNAFDWWKGLQKIKF